MSKLFTHKRPSKTLLAIYGLSLVATLIVGIIGVYASDGAHAASVTITTSGEIAEMHEDNFDSHSSKSVFYLKTDDHKRYRLTGNQTRLDQAARRRATVSGSVSSDGRELAVQTLSTSSLAATAVTSPSQSAAAATPTTIDKLLIIQFNFTNNTTQPATRLQLRQAIFTDPGSTKNMYLESSYGKLTLSSIKRPDGDIAGWYTISADSTVNCDYQSWADMADAKSKLAGIDPAAYDHVAYEFPQTSSCSFAGVSDMQRRFWLNGGSQNLNLPMVVAHEFGHNMGFQHATDWICTDSTGARVAISASCHQQYEYGDPFTPMGDGYYQFDAFQRDLRGWFDAGRIQTVKASNIYVLQPIESQGVTSGLQALRFMRDAATSYYLEFRQPIGLDSRIESPQHLMNGLKITLADDYGSSHTVGTNRSHLIDTTPGSNPLANPNFDAFDAQLAAGKTYTDSVTQTTITALGLNAAGAMRVRVTLGPDTIAPSTPTATSTTASPSSVSVNWTPASDNRAVSGYRIYRNGKLLSTAAASARAYTDTTASANSTTRYAYQVTAIDAASNESVFSNIVGTGDLTAPTPPTNASITYPSGGPVMVSWTASVSSDVANYHVYRDYLDIASTTGSNYTDNQVTVPGRAYTYYITAVDAAGNESAPSNSIAISF